MASGSGPTVGGPSGLRPEDDVTGEVSPEDAPVRPSATAPPAPSVVPRLVLPTPSARDVGTPALRERASVAPQPPALQVRAVTPGPAGTPVAAVVAGAPAGPVAVVVAEPPIRGTPIPAPGRGPTVRSSPSVMVSPSAVPLMRDAQAVAAPRSDRNYVQPAYRQGKDQLPARGAAARPLDAPIAQDLFREGGFEDLDGAAAPFDDQPAQVMEDVGQPYTTVYTVGDPPPLPGIADRFTPPAPQPTEIGQRRARSDASGSPSPDRKERFEPTPAPIRRAATPRLMAAAPTPLVVAEAKRDPSWMWFGIASAGFGVVGLFSLIGAVALVYGGAGSGAGPTRGSGDDEEPAGLVEVSRPGPKPASAEPAETAPVTTGKLKVRANRRALVYVDDQAVGYTPASVDLPPGTHSLSAMMPGQPNSRQSRQAIIPKPGDTVAVEFTF